MEQKATNIIAAVGFFYILVLSFGTSYVALSYFYEGQTFLLELAEPGEQIFYGSLILISIFGSIMSYDRFTHYYGVIKGKHSESEPDVEEFGYNDKWERENL